MDSFLLILLGYIRPTLDSFCYKEICADVKNKKPKSVITSNVIKNTNKNGQGENGKIDFFLLFFSLFTIFFSRSQAMLCIDFPLL